MSMADMKKGAYALLTTSKQFNAIDICIQWIRLIRKLEDR